MEAASRGCAVIISNKGGLKETITNGIILKNNSINDIFKVIDELIKNKKKLLDLQKKSNQNFYLTNKYINKKIDFYIKKLNFNSSNEITRIDESAILE